jgi:hypothetical protein
MWLLPVILIASPAPPAHSCWHNCCSYCFVNILINFHELLVHCTCIENCMSLHCNVLMYTFGLCLILFRNRVDNQDLINQTFTVHSGKQYYQVLYKSVQTWQSSATFLVFAVSEHADEFYLFNMSAFHIRMFYGLSRLVVSSRNVARQDSCMQVTLSAVFTDCCSLHKNYRLILATFSVIFWELQQM